MNTPEPRTIRTVLERAVAETPDAPALVFEGATYTYAELHEAALARLGALQAEGFAAGSVVLVMLDNTDQSVVTWLAVALGGGVEVPVNTALIGETLSHIVDDSGAEMVITERVFVDRLAAVARGSLHSILVIDDVDGYEGDDAVRLLGSSAGPGVPVGRGELAETAVMYTSGTTGPSKGAVITERHAFEYAGACAEMLEVTAADRYYAPLPLFHIAGRWAVVYAALQRGATAVLVRRFSISSFWDDVRHNDVTVTFLLGAMAQFVLNLPRRLDDDTSSLDRVLMVPLIEDLDDFRSRFDVRVTTCFGSTEANVPMVADWGVRATDGAGRVRNGYRVRLVDSDGQDVPTGTAGELWLAHDEAGMLVQRYHGNPEATAAAIQDGWIHTGDVFMRDDRDHFHFVDRLKDSLRRRGENISSFEVEREVRSHPDVMDCAVVGVPSAFSEEEIAAFVQVSPEVSVTADEIKAHVLNRAPKFLVPDHVYFVSEFPTTPTGKIQKFELRNQLSASVGHDQVNRKDGSARHADHN